MDITESIAGSVMHVRANGGRGRERGRPEMGVGVGVSGSLFNSAFDCSTQHAQDSHPEHGALRIRTPNTALPGFASSNIWERRTNKRRRSPFVCLSVLSVAHTLLPVECVLYILYATSIM